MGKSMLRLLYLTEVFLLVLSIPYKYKLVQESKTWSDAQTYCRANYIDLATVEGNEDMIKLQNEAQKQQFTSNAWIGLYNDVNSWRWSLGNEPLSFTDWCGPDPNYDMEACVAFHQWCWFDLGCSTLYPFMCFDDKNTALSKNVLISTPMSFLDAQSYCRKHHTDLVTVRDAQENIILKRMVTSNTWFGLHRDVWKWSNQSILSTQIIYSFSWVRESPWSLGVDDNCGNCINGQVDGAPCSKMMPFFCDSDFAKKQTITIKVKSDQDMNDPAVKEALLQKIKQKLKENGTPENTTVKWIKQPDGIVFHKMNKNNDVENKTREKMCPLNLFNYNNSGFF